MTYYFETYGCQMNVAESNAAEGLLLERGWSAAGSAEEADMVVINTCSVRQTAENRVFGRLGYYTAMKRERAISGAKSFALVVMGCMAERISEQLKKDYPAIDYVVGNFQKQCLGDIADAVSHSLPLAVGSLPIAASSMDAYFPPVSSVLSLSAANRLPLTASSYVPIMHGCNNYCTYCIVPYLRGREVSRPVDEILGEVDTLSAAGVKEITLLGQNVNSYHGRECSRSDTFRQAQCTAFSAQVSGASSSKEHSSTRCHAEAGHNDGTVSFADLLRIIDGRLRAASSPIRWVRFMSSHPKDLTADVIRAIAECPAVCHHIHLPVQHGSTRILQAMNRRYTREEYIALVGRIREAIPDVSLTTDIMVGFPGETEEDFAAVLSLMDEVRYENAFMYYYNVREGTPAAAMESQVPLEVKKARLQQVIDRQLKITAQVMAERVGSSERVLVEGVSRDDKGEMLGHTSRDERVAFKGDASLAGQFVTVKLAALNGHTFKGERVATEMLQSNVVSTPSL